LRLRLICALVLGATCQCLSADVHFEKKRLTDVFHSEGAAAGDFNRDGHTDVVSGPYWYAGPTFDVRHEYAPVKSFDPARGYSDNFFAFTHDFNADGWADVLILGFPGTTAAWYENPRENASGHWRRHLVIDKGVDNESPTFTDLTGDGKPELVYTRTAGSATRRPTRRTRRSPGPSTPSPRAASAGRSRTASASAT